MTSQFSRQPTYKSEGTHGRRRKVTTPLTPKQRRKLAKFTAQRLSRMLLTISPVGSSRLLLHSLRLLLRPLVRRALLHLNYRLAIRRLQSRLKSRVPSLPSTTDSSAEASTTTSEEAKRTSRCLIIQRMKNLRQRLTTSRYFTDTLLATISSLRRR